MHFSGYLAAGRRFFYVFVHCFYFLAYTLARFCERETEAQGRQISLRFMNDFFSPMNSIDLSAFFLLFLAVP